MNLYPGQEIAVGDREVAIVVKYMLDNQWLVCRVEDGATLVVDDDVWTDHLKCADCDATCAPGYDQCSRHGGQTSTTAV